MIIFLQKMYYTDKSFTFQLEAQTSMIDSLHTELAKLKESLERNDEAQSSETTEFSEF